MNRSTRPGLLFVVLFLAFVVLVVRYAFAFSIAFWVLLFAGLIWFWVSSREKPARLPKPVPSLFDRRSETPDQILRTLHVPTEAMTIIVGRCDICGQNVQADHVMWMAEDRQGERFSICTQCRDSLILIKRQTTHTV